MKKIIAGRRYDTDTSTLIARWDNGYGLGDFYYLEERLFQTPKGAWFLTGFGGAMTSYARAAGPGWSGGDELRPITEGDAMVWLQEHDFNDEIEQHFGSLITDA